MIAPELTTARLVLRAPRPDDFDAALAMWTDPQVVRFIGGRAQSREEVWGRILRYIGHWRTLGYGFWTIADRDDGAFLGECGFADFHREIAPAIDVPEMGWALVSGAHGQGYASEALAAAAAWGDAHLDAPRTACIIDPDNAPSLRVAARLGFRETRRTLYREAPTVVLHRLRGG
jgi:RimJ/RimL family protein N-acetyltransferase